MVNPEKSLDLLLRQVSMAQTNKISSMLNEVNLHKGQNMMILLLSMHKGLSQKELSEKLLVTPATVSKMVKRLEKTGFVERKRDTSDERVSKVSLTEKGKEVSDYLSNLQMIMEDTVSKGFSQEEKEDIKRYLARILDNLST